MQLWLDFMDQDLNITHPIFEKNIHKQYLKKLEDNGFTPLQASSIFSIWSDIVGSYSTSPWQSSTNLT